MSLAIELEDLRKTFGGDVLALDGVSLGVEQGTIFGLLGPNGAGKTTVVRILTTVLQPDSGTARVLGHDVVHRGRDRPHVDRSRRAERGRGREPHRCRRTSGWSGGSTTCRGRR